MQIVTWDPSFTGFVPGLQIAVAYRRPDSGWVRGLSLDRMGKTVYATARFPARGTPLFCAAKAVDCQRP